MSSSSINKKAKNSRQRYIPFLFLVILFFSFALRIFRLEEQSIWWDEGISLHLATSSLPEIVADRLDNIHPPLYFFILKGWVSLVGVGPFSARYLSVLFSWFQVVLLWVFARRWFGINQALVAASFGAISAVSVIYAQEIRVYALLPVIYLSLLGLTWEYIHEKGSNKQRHWLIGLSLGIITWIGLHLHYIVFFAIIYVSCWVIIVFFRERRWKDFIHWLSIQTFVIIFSLPWFVALIANWSAARGEANVGTFITDPVPIGFLISQVWAFLLTGLAGALAVVEVRWIALSTGIILLILAALRIYFYQTRMRTIFHTANFLIPLASALVVWSVRSFSHPRYVAIFAPGLIILVTFLIYPMAGKIKSPQKLLTWLLSFFLTIGVASLSIWGLSQYFFNPEIAKDDMRGAANYLEQTAAKQDLIIVPDTDWSFRYEYQGDAAVIMPGIDSQIDAWEKLNRYTSDLPKIFVIDYQRGTRDWQNLLPFALEKSGREVQEIPFDGLVVKSFELDKPVSPPEIGDYYASFGIVKLNGIWYEKEGLAGDNLTIALRWQVDDPLPENLNIALRLLDIDGWPIATNDYLLIDPQGRPTSLWTPGLSVVTFHTLPIPQATPPLDYNLALQVYADQMGEIHVFDVLDSQGAPQGQEAKLADVTIIKGRKIGQNPDLKIDFFEAPEILAQGLSLIGAQIPPDPYTGGQNLSVQLLWEASDNLADLRPALVLMQDGRELIVDDDAPVNGRYPTTLWEPGEQILDRRTLLIPADISGSAQLAVRLNESQVELGDIEIHRGDHNFTKPQVEYPLDQSFGGTARLIGFELPDMEYTAGDVIPLTLYWESAGDGLQENFVVFTHLLAEDGHLIGQHDGQPGNGLRPTTSWVLGEYIEDRHELTFREPEYSGLAQIEVGLYDPINGERLVNSNGEDHIILPITLTIRD